MNTNLRTVLTLGLVMIFAALAIPVSAQDGGDEACTELVTSALNLSREACDGTGRNQACYGNIILEVEPQPGINNLEFEERGDVADVESVRTLQLSSMNNQTDEWGVAYLQLQANIPDEDAQNVTLLLFGDVGVENAVELTPDPVTIEVTATSNANVRGGPSTNNAVVGTVAFNDVIVADGRIEDSSWVRIQLEDGTPGWIFTQLVSTDDDIETLDIVNADGTLPEPALGPMQAFFVETGVDDAPCEAAPDSGILVQTPEGVAEINLLVNEVDIRLRATAYIQSQPNVEMTVAVVDGRARVTAQGQSVLVPAGTLVRIPMNGNNQASGPPSAPESYDALSLTSLPIGNLPSLITVAEGLTEEELAEAAASIDGLWEVVAWADTCDEQLNLTPRVGGQQQLTMQADGSILGEQVAGHGFLVDFNAFVTEAGDYLLDFGNTPPAGAPLNEYRLTIIDPSNIEIIRDWEFQGGTTVLCQATYTMEPI